MSLLFPALRQAVRDLTLRGNAFRTYAYLLDDLDFIEFRVIKNRHLQRVLGQRKGTIREHLDLLVRLRYLELGPSEGVFNTYRIVWNPGGSQIDPIRSSTIRVSSFTEV